MGAKEIGGRERETEREREREGEIERGSFIHTKHQRNSLQLLLVKAKKATRIDMCVCFLQSTYDVYMAELQNIQNNNNTKLCGMNCNLKQHFLKC